ncbi:Mu transposase domain-containing protein [Kitasatospora nipponensis]
MDAEVDFGEVWVDLADERTKCYLFAFRLAYSGKAIHRITASCGQEAFLDGHMHAFRTLGGVPGGQIWYDNLSPAVSWVIRKSRSREEHPRWTDFRQHFSVTPFYCEPGLRGAHEKGGVEGQVGYWRRNYLTPVPRVESLDELNTAFAEFERAEEGRRIGMRIRTIGQDFAQEAPLLLPLPAGPFETGMAFTPRVDRYGMVAVRVCRYSVPVRFIGRTGPRPAAVHTTGRSPRPQRGQPAPEPGATSSRSNPPAGREVGPAQAGEAGPLQAVNATPETSSGCTGCNGPWRHPCSRPLQASTVRP